MPSVALKKNANALVCGNIWMKYFYSVREDFIEKKEKEDYIPLDSKK